MRRMTASRSVSLALALLFVARHLAAQNQQWEPGPPDGNGTISWDRATLVRQDENVIRVWIRTDFFKIQYRLGSDSLTYMRVVARYDLDCTRKVSRIVESHWYAPSGTLVRSSDQITEWAEFVPGGSEAKTLVLVCASQSGTRLATRPAAPSSTAPSATSTVRTAPAAPAANVQPETRSGHSGFHAAVGIGYGSAGVSCDGCGTDRENSVSVLLRFGGAITPRAVLSGEFIGWARTFYDGTTEALAWSMVVTQFYPSPASGFYVKLGSGLATGQLTAFVPGFGSVQMNRGAGVGIDVGAGFDMPVSRGFSFTPFVDYLYGSPSSIVVNGTDTGSKLGTNLVHIGLAASWR